MVKCCNNCSLTFVFPTHYSYELPDSHPLLEGDIHSELTLLYRTGNVASIEEKYESCNCNETQSKVDASNIGVGSNIETVSGTLLITCRTTNKEKFPLNGTYFQVNEGCQQKKYKILMLLTENRKCTKRYEFQ
uniref:Demeter RRM-fold domain-containing protein n=1 Tax=Solanum lycopersicum TaxID=4081 RepID=K4BRL1_SOLLC